MGRKTYRAIWKQSDRYRLILWGVVAGLAAALAAVAYRQVLAWAEEGRAYLFSLAVTPARIVLLFLGLMVLGFIAGKLTQGEPLIRGSGIPQVEGQLQGWFSPRWLPVLVKKFIAGALCILGGLSLGREGPSIQLGAMAAQGVCQGTKRSGVETKYLLTCGACAGLAAAFNAPLAGVLFALEEIHKNFSNRALFSAMAAALCADWLSKAFFGTETALALPAAEAIPVQYILLLLLFGAGMGAFSWLYNTSLLGLQKAYGKLKLPLWAKICIPFLLAGVVGLLCPALLGGGHSLIHGLSAGDFSLGMMAVLLLGKFVFSMVCFCSGAPGGIFFPMLVLGAFAGGIFGTLSNRFLGLPETYILNFMLLGMTGLFSGVVRAPLTGIVLVLEMSGSLTHLLGLGVVACAASITADLLHVRPIYEALLDAMVPDNLERKPATEHTIIDITISYRSPLVGMRIAELTWPADSLSVSIIRSGEEVVPHGDTVLQAGDLMTVLCPSGMESAVRSAFQGPSDGL